jgi:hypothetical protein
VGAGVTYVVRVVPIRVVVMFVEVTIVSSVVIRVRGTTAVLIEVEVEVTVDRGVDKQLHPWEMAEDTKDFKNSGMFTDGVGIGAASRFLTVAVSKSVTTLVAVAVPVSMTTETSVNPYMVEVVTVVEGTTEITVVGWRWRKLEQKGVALYSFRTSTTAETGLHRGFEGTAAA